MVAASGTAALAGCTFQYDDDGFEVSLDSDDSDDASDDSGTGDDSSSEPSDDTATDDTAGSTDDDGSDSTDDDGTDSTDDDATDPADDDGTDAADDDDDDPGETDDEATLSFSEDCIGVDPSNLAIDELSGNRWRISSGNVGLLVFDEKEHAEAGKEIIEHYGFTSICFVRRPDPSMTYWLVDGDAPTASGTPAGGEDCIGVDPSDLAIDEISGDRWRIRSGNTGLIVFDEKENAERAKEVIEHYGFTSICFVGRPNPPMTYWTD
ncbi:hypothetical protein GCM10025298_30780 [Natronobiforma cellulositropha]